MLIIVYVRLPAAVLFVSSPCFLNLGADVSASHSRLVYSRVLVLAMHRCYLLTLLHGACQSGINT